MRLALLTSLFLALGTIVFGQTTRSTPSETVTTHYPVPVSNVSTTSYETNRSSNPYYETRSTTTNNYNNTYYPPSTTGITVNPTSFSNNFITTERRIFQIFGIQFAVSIDSLIGFMQGVAFTLFIIYIIVAIRRFQGK